MEPKTVLRRGWTGDREMDPIAEMPTTVVSRTCRQVILKRGGEMGNLDNRQSHLSEIETEGRNVRLRCPMERKRNSASSRTCRGWDWAAGRSG